ncbi:MAG: hypothetical protein NTZ97_04595 [Candidatus Moranbacteria bacterium]|nr:hypothetical protein [Candidatus Moranbacteria bacterium]
MAILSEKLKNALSQFNLKESEIITYVALLEIGTATIQEISRQTKINRVTTYAAIDKLKDAGLVAGSKKGKRLLFVAEDPEILRSIINRKSQQLEQNKEALENLILPTLRAIDISEEKRPQIKFFEGLNGIYKVYDDYVLKYKDVVSYGSYDSVLKVSSEKMEIDYFSELQKRKIFFRSILENTELNKKFAGLSKGVMHTKFLEPGLKVSADILIFGSTVALISYDTVVATLIEDESISKSMKMFFEFMWERL